MSGIRQAFEIMFPPPDGVYWNEEAACYMRDAGCGLHVAVHAMNDKLEGFDAALKSMQFEVAATVSHGYGETVGQPGFHQYVNVDELIPEGTQLYVMNRLREGGE